MKAETLATGDIVVVGAGLAGLSTAWELKKRGFDVILAEQRFPAYGASGRNPGAIWLQTRRRGVELNLAKAGVTKYRELLTELGDVFDFRQEGGLFFYESEDQQEVLASYCRDRQQAGLKMHLLDRAAALQQSPLLPQTAIGAVYCEDDAQIDTVKFAQALTAACVKAGVRKYENTAVLSTLRENDTVFGVRTVRGEIHAPGVVWATGAWSTNLRSEGINVLAETYRLGQVLTQPNSSRSGTLLRGPRGVRSNGALTDIKNFQSELFSPRTNSSYPANFADDLGYDDTISQGSNGSIYIGNSFDGQGSLNPHISIGATNAMISMTVERFPELATSGVTGLWAGLGSETADQLPIIDHVDGTYLNVAHAWGVASGPISGQVMAQIIAGEDSQFADDLRYDRATLTVDSPDQDDN